MVCRASGVASLHSFSTDPKWVQGMGVFLICQVVFFSRIPRFCCNIFFMLRRFLFLLHLRLMVRDYLESEWPDDLWPNFSWHEMRCQETGVCKVDDGFMDKLQKLRLSIASPLIVTSGYRSPDHSIEAAKIAKGKPPGAHATGKAVDIACDRAFAYQVLSSAMRVGFLGIGVQQSGARRFLHLDTIGPEDGFHVARPALWSY